MSLSLLQAIGNWNEVFGTHDDTHRAYGYSVNGSEKGEFERVHLRRSARGTIGKRQLGWEAPRY